MAALEQQGRWNRGRTEMVAADAAQSKPQPVLVDQSGYSSHTATQRAVEAKATYLPEKAAPINANLLMESNIYAQLQQLFWQTKQLFTAIMGKRQNLVF